MIHKFFEHELLSINTEIKEGFLKHKDSDDTINSHYFENRFENIYIKQSLIPALAQVFAKVLAHAAVITRVKKERLQLGYWFNYMQPGHKTLAHSHDENDELLSGVYYISVPDNSGSLYLGENNNQTVIDPQESLLVFFPPDIVHSVGSNKSGTHRLSIGINIGGKNN